ncbi:hypothetical protein O9929_19440 [Vibrio lentus]|nr:hypothetical protein [Vibrio lentus]
MQRAAQQKWTFNHKWLSDLALALKLPVCSCRPFSPHAAVLQRLLHQQMIVVVQTVEKKTGWPQLSS